MIQLKTTTAYTIDEVAEITHLSRFTIYKYIKNGTIRAQKVGKSWYITDKTLAEFVTGEREDQTKATR